MSTIVRHHNRDRRLSSNISFLTSLPIPNFCLILVVSLLSLSFNITNNSVECIKINRFQVPEAVERGRSAVLYCDYTLEDREELYSFKLYKNNVEFYRYVPGEDPPRQSYKSNGIYVNLSASNATHAILAQTNLHSDGLYICEISTEGPTFSTVRSEQLMKIYVLPNENVQIEGALEQYNYGENISLLCKSGKSWPIAQLEWFINDKPIAAEYTTDLTPKNYSLTDIPSDGVQSILRLNIRAQRNHFIKGYLEIRCKAVITLIYQYEQSANLVTGSFKNKLTSKFSNSARRDWSVTPNLKTPIISGLKRNYRLNDMMKLNCSSTFKNAKLKWLIMNREANETHLIRHEQGYSRMNQILGLWLRMEKRLLQMRDLRFQCVAEFPKQIAQFFTKLQIRTFDNQTNDWQWQSPFGSSDGDGSEHNSGRRSTSITTTDYCTTLLLLFCSYLVSLTFFRSLMYNL